MSLKSTRKIISVILTCIVSFSIVCFVVSAIFTLSLANSNYICKHFVSDSMVSECNAQMNMKFDALEVKSNIPSRVFKTVQKDFDTKASLTQAMQGVFNDFDSLLLNDSHIEYFSNLCIEYLEGNNISYSKESVKNTAYEAAKIYSDCVGIHNCSYLKDSVEDFKNRCSKISMVSLLAVVFAVIFLALIYRKKSHALPYVLAGCSASGIAIVLGSVLMLVMKTGSDIAIYPAVYQQSFYSMVKGVWIILLMAGAVITVASYIGFAIQKKQKEKESKEDI